MRTGEGERYDPPPFVGDPPPYLAAPASVGWDLMYTTKRGFKPYGIAFHEQFQTWVTSSLNAPILNEMRSSDGNTGAFLYLSRNCTTGLSWSKSIAEVLPIKKKFSHLPTLNKFWRFRQQLQANREEVRESARVQA